MCLVISNQVEPKGQELKATQLQATCTVKEGLKNEEKAPSHHDNHVVSQVTDRDSLLIKKDDKELKN